jgi:nicotinate phosphoribosyltransferase
MGGVYKLVEIEGPNGMRPVLKTSIGKSTRPGAKQVWRVLDRGAAVKDVVALVTEPRPAGGDALLQPLMRMGTRLAESPALADLRAACAERIAMMPRSIRELEPNDDYPVELSPAPQPYAGE